MLAIFHSCEFLTSVFLFASLWVPYFPKQYRALEPSFWKATRGQSNIISALISTIFKTPRLCMQFI